MKREIEAATAGDPRLVELTKLLPPVPKESASSLRRTPLLQFSASAVPFFFFVLFAFPASIAPYHWISRQKALFAVCFRNHSYVNPWFGLVPEVYTHNLLSSSCRVKTAYIRKFAPRVFVVYIYMLFFLFGHRVQTPHATRLHRNSGNACIPEDSPWYGHGRPWPSARDW